MRDKSIDERLAALEANFSVPGTMITRQLIQTGIRWSLAIGVMGMPKAFYYGDTIEAALTAAEDGSRSLEGE